MRFGSMSRGAFFVGSAGHDELRCYTASPHWSTTSSARLHANAARSMGSLARMTTTAATGLQAQTQETPQTYLNYIGGEWRPTASGETFDDTNPAHRGQVVARFQRSTVADVEAAITAAQRALPAWRAMP